MDKKTPLVSVMCLTYNHEPYLRQALDSILMQKTNFPFEVLIGEDCSPDNSREILKEYEERYPHVFQMFYREKNIGATRNLHDLFIRAVGKYIIFLETDDYWTDPFKLQKQVDFLEQNPEYIGCAHSYITINEKIETICFRDFSGSDQNRLFTLHDFINGGFAFQTSTVMAQNIFLDGKDYSIIYKSHPLVGDLTLFSLLLSRGNFFLLPDCMSTYRRIIKSDGTSAASQAIAHRAKDLTMTMRQLVMLEEHFASKIDYSPMKRYPVERYLTGWLRREPEFTAEGMKYMWANAGKAVQKQTITFALGYPMRKVNKLWKKLIREDQNNG